MPNYSSLTTSARVVFARKALVNTRDVPEITRRMQKRGYDEAEIKRGFALVERVEGLLAKAQVDLGDQKGATRRIRKMRKEAKGLYRDLRDFGKVAFEKDSGPYTALGLNKPIPDADGKWDHQSRMFFDVLEIDPALKDGLLKGGALEEEIQTCQALVSGIQEEHRRRLVIKGTKENATEERQDAMAELDQYMADFIAIARIEFRRDVEYLEMLGIREKP